MYEMLLASSLTGSRGWPLVVRVGRLLAEAGVVAYVVGGWIRDTLLGRDSEDLDLAVAADGIEVAARMARALGGSLVVLDRDRGVGRVVIAGEDGDQTLDFTGYAGSIEEDLGRRDFAVDAMAINLGEFGAAPEVRLVDPFGGLGDLRQRSIRVTGDAVIAADPVRMLRGIRLAAQLGFTVESRTELLLQENASLLSKSSCERVREELACLLSIRGSGRLLSYMEELGLLGVVFPEIGEMRGVVQPREHFWDVLQHCLKTAEALDHILGQGEWRYAETATAAPVWSSETGGYFDAEVGRGCNRAALFRLAALLHDVAKPATKTVDSGGRVRFLGHAQRGAEIATAALQRLRFSNREVKLVEVAIRHHLRPTQMGWPELPTRRAVYRYLRDTGDAAEGVLCLSMADHLATRGPGLDQENWRMHASIARNIFSQRDRRPDALRPLVDGYDIMDSFGLKPGRRIGELLEEVSEAQAAGEVSSREEALALVGRLLDAPVSQDSSRSRDAT